MAGAAATRSAGTAWCTAGTRPARSTSPSAPGAACARRSWRPSAAPDAAVPPVERLPGGRPMTEPRARQGWNPAIGDQETLAEVVDAAFDYRGDVTITTRDGAEWVGYVCN